MTLSYSLSESGLVYAVVNVAVRPVIDTFDLLLERFGEQVDVRVIFWEDVVEFGVKHADDFAGLVDTSR